MIVKLNKMEVKLLKALDARPKERLTAREVGADIYRKREENLTAEEIRAVRNAARKLDREELLEMPAEHRGTWKISERGKKLAASGKTEFVGKFERGEALAAMQERGAERLAKLGKKNTPKKKPAAKSKPKAKKKDGPIKKARRKKAAARTKAKTPAEPKNLKLVNPAPKKEAAPPAPAPKKEEKKPEPEKKVTIARKDASGKETPVAPLAN